MSSPSHVGLNKEITNLLEKISSVKHDISILIVANIKGSTKTDDYEKFSVITDFFSDQEIEELIVAFRDFGFYVQTYFDEKDFIAKITKDGLDSIPGKYKIIYGTAQKGIGAARHSLMPAFCKLYGIPYMGSNGYVSSLCRHKYHFNTLLRKHHQNLPTAWMFENGKWLMDERPPTGLKVIFKPVYEAASVGISSDSIIFYSSEKDSILTEHYRIFRQPIIIEEFIDGYEVEVPLLLMNGHFFGLGPIGISLDGDRKMGERILSYETVYDDLFSFYEFNELSQKLNDSIVKCASDSAKILGIEDFARIDFRITPEGNYYLMDITTNPHLTKHSSCNFAFNKLGLTHSQLLVSISAITANRYMIC